MGGGAIHVNGQRGPFGGPVSYELDDELMTLFLLNIFRH